MSRTIRIKGATHHNLKNIDLAIPREKLVVICGPSGSGKSTLAFDIIYAEGQRRYVESLSVYARQFLPQMEKPRVEKIEGLTPSIALEQQGILKNPRSTVGTSVEVYDFLRVLFARIGVPHCPRCGEMVASRSEDEIVDSILSLPEGTRFLLMAPVVEFKKGTHVELFKRLRARGFVRVMVDGEIHHLSNPPSLEKNRKHSIFVVVDRLILKGDIRRRLADSLELALSVGGGNVVVKVVSGEEEEIFFSTSSVCPRCKVSFPPVTPQLFSFNSPQGACERCMGLGSLQFFDPELLIPNKGLTIDQGGILLLRGKSYRRFRPVMEAIARSYGFSLETTPIKDIPPQGLSAIFFGEPSLGWKGLVVMIEEGTFKGRWWRSEFSRFRRSRICPGCGGARLNPFALSVKIEGLSIYDLCQLSIRASLSWVRGLPDKLEPVKREIAMPLLKEIIHRLSFMERVGLDYLSLSRDMSTLSGGEAQRIRLASQLGTGLEGITYVLDEPSIGLHPRDNKHLFESLRELRDRGNTVIVVEHDEGFIRNADHIIELGPGSGILGGEVVFQGEVDGLLRAHTLTGRYLRGEMKIPYRSNRRSPTGYIELKGVSTHNLKDLDVRIPLGVFVCVTGVSGSGKSSLITDTLYKHLALLLGIKVDMPGSVEGISGWEKIERLVFIDQSPIGRTPRSNPATYTKIFDDIRTIFASTPEARARGYRPGRFSFNVPGGRCEKCHGDGYIKIQMHFLPDVYVRCDVCDGKRYNRETLDIRYKGLNIAQVLDLSVKEAKNIFFNHSALKRKLEILEDVGLDYIKLGQPATTLSGGEAQRLKISRELGRRNVPGTMYILDEPTTGLHIHEVGKLLEVLHKLVDKGGSVIVIEHNPYIIRSADYVLDLGPGGGEFGGEVVSSGTPEEIKQDPNSVTGKFL